MARTSPYNDIAPRRGTPQNERADKRQVKNSAGGYTFTLEPLDQAARFLILGSDSGTYYATPQKLTKANAEVLIAICETEQHRGLVDLIVEISTEGRAPKQTAGLFALAVACSFGTAEQRGYALTKIPVVCRTATSLFTFTTFVEQFRGWGPALVKGVARWYTESTIDGLAYQMVKYRQRDGWTHRDLLRVCHPHTDEQARKDLFEWAVRGTDGSDTALAALPHVVLGYERSKDGTNLPALIERYNLPWEALPTDALNDREVWEALLDTGALPLGALIRQLPRLTRLGVLDRAAGLGQVIDRITDVGELRRARQHPINLLIAQRTYASGRSEKGSGVWSANRKVIAALDKAFYVAFKTVEPTHKRHLLALDVSGSMGWGQVSGTPLTPREGSAAMALATVAIEDHCDVVGFTAGHGQNALVDLNGAVDPSRRLDDVVQSISGLPFGRTDCALPFQYAKQARKKYDAVIIYTDNETWAGGIHPHEALRQYRESSGIDCASIVVAMTSTGFTIADPSDPKSLDVVGFDSAVPSLIAEFVK